MTRSVSIRTRRSDAPEPGGRNIKASMGTSSRTQSHRQTISGIDLRRSTGNERTHNAAMHRPNTLRGSVRRKVRHFRRLRRRNSRLPMSRRRQRHSLERAVHPPGSGPAFRCRLSAGRFLAQKAGRKPSHSQGRTRTTALAFPTVERVAAADSGSPCDCDGPVADADGLDGPAALLRLAAPTVLGCLLRGETVCTPDG